jgi:High potential iron-sulfur protein
MNVNIDDGNRKQLNDNVEKDILSRRVVLRGALVVGCSLLVPATLFSSPANSANPAASTAAKKVSKATVHYQAQPKDEQKCSDCQQFIAKSNTCQLVDGQISPSGWCNLWAKNA